MLLTPKTLCAAFLAASCVIGSGCSTHTPYQPPVKQEFAYFKNDLMNKSITLIAQGSIRDPKPEDLAKAAIDGVRKSLGTSYSNFSDKQIKAIIDDQTSAGHEKIFITAVTAAAESLSPHDVYMSGSSVKEYFIGIKTMRGIGVTLIGDPDTNGLMIEEIADVGPEERLQLHSGDVITAVDGTPIAGDMVHGLDMIRGEEGTAVMLTVIPASQKTSVQIKVTRGAFQFNPVLSKLIDDVAYIRLRDFQGFAVAKLIEEAIVNMQKESAGRPIKGYILDLRGNVGGLVSAATRIADNFIDSNGGLSFHVQGKKVSYDEKLKPGDILKGAPIVVLINDESASASEILSGVLQDYKRATVIGTQSFGKGSIQTTEYLSYFDKSRNDAVRITSGLYFLPSGASPQRYGIIPDILVENVGPVRNDHEREMANAIPNPAEALSKDRHPSAGCKMNPDLRDADVPQTMRELRGLPDKALICAVDYLRHTTTYSSIESKLQVMPARAPAP